MRVVLLLSLLCGDVVNRGVMLAMFGGCDVGLDVLVGCVALYPGGVNGMVAFLVGGSLYKGPHIPIFWRPHCRFFCKNSMIDDLFVFAYEAHVVGGDVFRARTYDSIDACYKFSPHARGLHSSEGSPFDGASLLRGTIGGLLLGTVGRVVGEIASAFPNPKGGRLPPRVFRGQKGPVGISVGCYRCGLGAVGYGWKFLCVVVRSNYVAKELACVELVVGDVEWWVQVIVVVDGVVVLL